MRLLILFVPLATVLTQNPLEEDKVPIATEVPEKVQKEIVDIHNEYRRNVKPSASNMVKMTWNNEVAETSKAWAEKCTGRRSRLYQRVLNGVQCGEATLQTTYALPWSEVIKSWFSKQSNFQYGIGAVDPKKDITIYTQLIWYNTHEVGCALSYCPGNEYPFFFICRYCPAGNVVGHLKMPYTKGKPCGECPNNCEDKLCTNPCKYQDNAYGCNELKNMHDCSQPPLSEECQATCNCETEIV